MFDNCPPGLAGMLPSLLLLLLSSLVVCRRTPSHHQALRRPPLHSHSREDTQMYKRSEAELMRSLKSLAATDCIPTDGTAYNGSASTTESGLTCHIWSITPPNINHSFTGVGDHNYCRSPDGDYNVWCFTTDPGKPWEYCDVPVCLQSVEEIGCLPINGSAYTGQASTTESGHVCQRWSDNSPHEHDNTDVGKHNLCRSPDGDAKPWCMTLNPRKKREHCDVPFCMIYTKGITHKYEKATFHTVCELYLPVIIREATPAKVFKSSALIQKEGLRGRGLFQINCNTYA